MSTTFTQNYGFGKPATGDPGWGPLRNTNVDDLDAELFKPRIGQATLTWGATTTVDLSAARVFVGTNTGISTIAFANVPSDFPNGAAVPSVRILLILTNGGANAITWPASVVWLSGGPPTLKVSGVDVLELTTRDGGTTWYAQPWYPRNPAPDVTTTNSGAGNPANLKAVVIPAGLIATIGQAVRIRAWGTGANNANAKSVRVTVGGNLLTGQGLQISTSAHWYMELTVYRTSATGAAVSMWGQNNGTAQDVVQSVSGLTVPDWTTTGITVQFDCTQTSAADVTQEGVSVELVGL